MTTEYAPLIIGFQGLEPDWYWLKSIRPFGVILFSRNIESPRQVHDLCAKLRRLTQPPFIAIDMEGGRVNRFSQVLGAFPGLAQMKTDKRARSTGVIMGQLLFALGIDVNFAPVVDLNYGHRANGLQDRTVGSNPEITAYIACAYLDGLRHAGVEGCFKHFPGLGTTLPDSHESLPHYRGDKSKWLKQEGQVYGMLAQRGYGDTPVMFAHCSYPFWPDEIASLGPSAVSYLRELGWRGLLMTDDFEMKALNQSMLASHAHMALDSGFDAVMICHDRDKIDRVIASLDSKKYALSPGAISFQRHLKKIRRSGKTMQLAQAIKSWQGCV